MEKFDVVIIGAGIGGLVCGCYLAKAGLKVLIVEQQDKPGGYCTSFERERFRFDVGVHYLGGIKRGVLGKILEDLDLKNKIQFNQFDPTDKIIMPDNITYIRKNTHDTIEEFKKSFPKESKNIDKFFAYIMKTNFLSMYKKLENFTFKDFLDESFEDYKLKSTLGILLNNIGLSASRASAIASIILYKEFVLDPGYYPAGGMGSLPFAIAQQFEKYGGKLVLNRKVVKINIRINKVIGVTLSGGERVISSFIVSNADAVETFRRLIDQNTLERKIIRRLSPSSSIFVLYLGIMKKIKEHTCNTWFSNTYQIDKYFHNLPEKVKNKKLSFFMISFPSEHDGMLNNTNNTVIQTYFITPYFSRIFWDKNRDLFADLVINNVENTFSPIRDKIKVQFTATPITFNKYTANEKGAAFGWASTKDQIHPSIFPQRTSIDGLVLAGHWCTVGSGQGGIPRVAFSGKSASKLILRNIKRSSITI